MPQPTKAQLAKYAKEHREYMANYAKTNPEDVISGYRHDPKSETGVESLPTYFKKSDILNTAKAMKNLQEIGGRTLTPQEYANLLLHEGRSDAGFNELDKNNKEANIFARQLYGMGHEDLHADTAAAIHQKMQQADRLGIPFGLAWNGTGSSKVQSGKQYAQKLQAAQQAAMHPSNQTLYDTVESILRPSEWNNINPTPATAGEFNFNKGGIAMPTNYTEGSWKLI